MRYYIKVGNKWTWLWKNDPYTEPDWYYNSKQEAIKASLKCRYGRYS